MRRISAGLNESNSMDTYNVAVSEKNGLPLESHLLKEMNPAGEIRIDLVLFFSALFAYLLASDFQLNDYDAVNYALAVREFNVALDMPHPPGAPVFVVLVKLVSFIVQDIPFALGLVSAAGGAIFVIVWRRIFALFISPRAAAIGTLVLAISPGMWMTSSQPMSDSMAGAMLSACILLGLYFARGHRPQVFWLFTALLALVVGIRPQFGLLAVFMLFASFLYFRLPKKQVFQSLAIFTCVNLIWLLPTVYSQYNLDGTGWMTYFNQIQRFREHFNSASGSPLLTGDIDLYAMLLRGGTHVGALGYFGLGLNLWYPESVGHSLQRLGTQLNPWYTDTAEWTVAGSLFTFLYISAAVVFVSRLAYYKKRSRVAARYLGYLLLFAGAYFIIVVMLVPPHIRFYLPIMPFFVLIALLGMQSNYFGNRLQYLLLFLALASTIPTLQDATRADAPPLALIHEIQNQTNVTGAGSVLYLNTNASRHALWYLPEAKVFRSEDKPTVDSLKNALAEEKMVFSNYAVNFPQSKYHTTEIANYRRPYRVWMRHTSSSLYQLKLAPRALALDSPDTVIVGMHQ